MVCMTICSEGPLTHQPRGRDEKSPSIDGLLHVLSDQGFDVSLFVLFAVQMREDVGIRVPVEFDRNSLGVCRIIFCRGFLLGFRD